MTTQTLYAKRSIEPMNKTEYKKRFNRLYSNLLGASAAFYAWKGLQNKNYESLYARANYFWGAVLIALQNEWLLGLAKCFEDSKYSKDGKVISVQALLAHHPDSIRAGEVEDILRKHRKVILSISRLRDHQLAHLNAGHLASPSTLLKKFPIKYEEVEDLLKDFPEVISLLDPESGIYYVLDNYTKEPEREAKNIMEKISYFYKKEKEHLDKFVAGEVNNHSFPPESTS